MLKQLIDTYPRILAECAIAERLRRVPDVTLHPTLFNTPLIYGPDHARQAMSALYAEYLNTARAAGLPLLLTAPTWRLDAERVREAKVPTSINSDAVAYLIGLRDAFTQGSSPPSYVGALVGPRHDCYRPDLAPDSTVAEAFHRTQILELGASPADFLLAQTLPSVAEALGIARAMARTDKPYLISFCTGPDGHVLDGTPLPAAMEQIDQATALARPPDGYFVNCTHPQFLLDAWPEGSLNRLIGIQANGSSKDVTKLDGAGSTQADPIEDWARAMFELHKMHDVSILGGCCGTALAHLQALVKPN